MLLYNISTYYIFVYLYGYTCSNVLKDGQTSAATTRAVPFIATFDPLLHLCARRRHGNLPPSKKG